MTVGRLWKFLLAGIYTLNLLGYWQVPVCAQSPCENEAEIHELPVAKMCTNSIANGSRIVVDTTGAADVSQDSCNCQLRTSSVYVYFTLLPNVFPAQPGYSGCGSQIVFTDITGTITMPCIIAGSYFIHTETDFIFEKVRHPNDPNYCMLLYVDGSSNSIELDCKDPENAIPSTTSTTTVRPTTRSLPTTRMTTDRATTTTTSLTTTRTTTLPSITRTTTLLTTTRKTTLHTTTGTSTHPDLTRTTTLPTFTRDTTLPPIATTTSNVPSSNNTIVSTTTINPPSTTTTSSLTKTTTEVVQITSPASVTGTVTDSVVRTTTEEDQSDTTTDETATTLPTTSTEVSTTREPETGTTTRVTMKPPNVGGSKEEGEDDINAAEVLFPLSQGILLAVLALLLVTICFIRIRRTANDHAMLLSSVTDNRSFSTPRIISDNNDKTANNNTEMVEHTPPAMQNDINESQEVMIEAPVDMNYSTMENLNTKTEEDGDKTQEKIVTDEQDKTAETKEMVMNIESDMDSENTESVSGDSTTPVYAKVRKHKISSTQHL